jgi:hypothetical protein
MNTWIRRGLAALAITTGLSTAGTALTVAPASASGPACGSTVGPQLNFDGLGHFVVTVGFTGAKRATAYSVTEYITVKNNGKTYRYLPNQKGTLLFRSSLTKRVVGSLPAGPTSIDVYMAGTFTLASTSVACVMAGYTSGGTF